MESRVWQSFADVAKDDRGAGTCLPSQLMASHGRSKRAKLRHDAAPLAEPWWDSPTE